MGRPTLVLFLIVLAGAGCSYMMPPQKIPMDRRNYIDAVSTSWKEQLLTNLVNLRYGDTLTFLEMTSVNTSYELGGNLTAGYTRGLAPTPGTTLFRNLVLGGGSVTYSDKPTISYAPIRGEALSKTLIMPIDPCKILKGIQTGWRPEYILSCCVKSINDLQNPQDENFFILADLFHDLRYKGVIRITIEDVKAPTKYDVTLHMKDKIFPGKEKVEPGEEAARKAATKPKKEKKAGEVANKKKEGKEDSEIGLLTLDKHRAKFLDKTPPKPGEATFGEKIQRFKILLWSGASPQGEGLYLGNCSCCHGQKGDGKGPLASNRGPKPADFNYPRFWMSDVDQKIDQAITSGHSGMPKLKMKPEEKELITSYIKQTFGRYEVYKIIDGNQQPRPLDPCCDTIVLQTRSVLQVFTYLAEFIDVPDEHVSDKQNRASKSMLYGQSLNGQVKNQIMFNIKKSKEYPKDTFVAVKQQNYWFYIDNKDIDSKEVFSGIAGILSMSEPGTKEGAPVLTLPVQ